MKRFIGCLILCVFFSPNQGVAFSPWGFKNTPKNRFEFHTDLKLKEDIYSNNLKAFLEIAPLKNFSVFGEISYRTFSYELDLSSTGKRRHTETNLDVSELNPSLLGVKILPFEFLGFSFSWQIPGTHHLEETKHILFPEIFFVTEFSNRLQFLYGIEYFFFIPKNDFSTGDVISLFFQTSWNLPFLEIDYSLFFRQRIKESKNENLSAPYQKQKDRFSSLHFKVGVWRSILKEPFSLALGLHYDYAHGLLYAKEPSHRIDISARFLW